MLQERVGRSVRGAPWRLTGVSPPRQILPDPVSVSILLAHPQCGGEF